MDLSKTYTIGRDNSCNIRIPDTVGYSDIGRVHAEISVNENSISITANKISYPVFVNRFKVKKKIIFQNNEIRLGRNFKFKLHHYFIVKENKIMGLRKRENDFSEEFKNLQRNWEQNYKKQKALQNRFSKKDIPVLIALAGIALMEYWNLKTFYSTRLFSIAVPAMYFLKENKRKKIAEKIKKENTCPKCLEYMDEKWETLKEKGGHNCGAFWHI
ncbi:MAG: FHA domain-containing protein [Saprospiraceae bacterium]